MVRKIISNLYLGFRGIILNKHLKLKQKFLLFVDYFKFVLLLFPVFILKIKINEVNIKSFKYKVYIQNYITFFYIFNEIFCKAVYEPYKINNFMDLGANIGLVIMWYKFFNPNATVIAFEPDKYNYQILLKNIEANKLTNVKVYQIALSDKKEKAKFFTIFDDIQNLDGGLTLNQDLPNEEYIVMTDKLSNYINENDPIDLVKMDIEGGEYKVFNDLFESKKINQIKTMVFEMHFFNKKQEEDLFNIINNLNKIGEINSLENSKVTKVFHFSSNLFK